jgi:hypothetical protein
MGRVAPTAVDKQKLLDQEPQPVLNDLRQRSVYSAAEGATVTVFTPQIPIDTIGCGDCHSRSEPVLLSTDLKQKIMDIIWSHYQHGQGSNGFPSWISEAAEVIIGHVS